MAYDFTQEDEATIGTTPRSCPADTTVGVPTAQTDKCWIQPWFRIDAMGVGDEFLVEVYEKPIASGAQTSFGSWRMKYPQDKLILPALLLGNGWDIVLSKVAGTDRNIKWSLRKVT